MTQVQVVATTLGVGIGATAIMDVWLVFLRWVGVQTQGFGLIGRWIGHIAKGRLTHQNISGSAPVEGELVLGWAAHYAIGIGFAGTLVAMAGADWLNKPTVLPGVAFGVSSVIIPLFVMQPAMGFGFAASRTARPLASCLRSLANHTVFGLGLYLSARGLAALMNC